MAMYRYFPGHTSLDAVYDPQNEKSEPITINMQNKLFIIAFSMFSDIVLVFSVVAV